MGNDEKVLLLGTQNQELIAISEKGKGKRFRLDVERSHLEVAITSCLTQVTWYQS